MDINKVEELYRQMGIGTQEERDQLVKLSEVETRSEKYVIFIETVPNLSQVEDFNNAKLA